MSDGVASSETGSESTSASGHDEMRPLLICRREKNEQGGLCKVFVLQVPASGEFFKVKCLGRVIEIPPQKDKLTIVVNPSTETSDEWTVNGCTLCIYSLQVTHFMQKRR